MERENKIVRRQYKMEASIHSHCLWRLETLSKQSEEKLEEYQGTTRDVNIVFIIHTWVRLEVRDEFITIGVRMNMCRDPWGLNWGLFGDVYWITIFSIMIINTILLCSTYQLMFLWELIDKLECSWCFYILIDKLECSWW